MCYAEWSILILLSTVGVATVKSLQYVTCIE